VLVISAYDVDYRQNRIMQGPKLPLYQISYDHNYRKKQTNQKKDAALYSNLQLDLSRGLFP
jgi:hypothetical protein